jgi:hypothetical protein
VAGTIFLKECRFKLSAKFCKLGATVINKGVWSFQRLYLIEMAFENIEMD